MMAGIRDTIFVYWSSHPEGNGLIVTAMPLQVHVVFSQDQARSVLTDYPGGMGTVRLEEQAEWHLPLVPRGEAVTVGGRAGEMLANLLVEASGQEDRSFATPVPAVSLFLPSMAGEDTTGEEPTLLTLEIDAEGGCHAYVMYSSTEGLRYLEERPWIGPKWRKRCIRMLTASTLPSQSRRLTVHIDGIAGREIFSAARIHLRRLAAMSS